MEPVVRDFRLALRRLRMAPGFTIFAVVSLALGIGVSTAIYSAVRTFFWTPLGIPNAREIVAVTSNRVAPAMSWLDFLDARAQQTGFRSLGASSWIRTAFASSRGAEVVLGDAVSGEYFSVMGVTPRYGRMLTMSDERESARVVVISERFWRTHFHSDPAIVGRTIRLGGVPFEIAGVVKGSFHGLERFQTRSVWVPITAVPRAGERFSSFSLWARLTDRQFGRVSVHGRLRTGVPAERGTSEVSLIGQRLDAAYPLQRREGRNWSLRLRATEGAESEVVNTVAGMILTSVGMLLLIACSNLANLALAKGTSRSEETAVRSALGASRWRLIREQLIECSLLVLMGGALGLWLLSALVDFLTIDLPMGQGIALAFRPEVNGAVLGASAASMVLAALVFGLWPAWQGTRPDVRARLGSAGSATPPRWRLHRNLVAWQVCGCVALTLVAAMTQRVIGAVGGTRPSVVSTKLAIAQIEFALSDKGESATRRIVDAVVAGVRRQPGIDRVIASTGLPFPFVSVLSGYMVTTIDAPFNDARDVRHSTDVIGTTPGLFETLGLSIVRGRGFTDRDDLSAPRVAVVTERLARSLFESTDVVGRSVLINRTPRLSSRYGPPESFTIVGVISNPDGSPRTAAGHSYLFVPWAQRFERGLPVVLTVHTSSPSAAVGMLRSTIREVDRELPVSLAGTGAVVLEGPVFLLRVIRGLATVLAALSLVLAMAGLFGVLSHLVQRRTREIGIRLALGADRAGVFRLILRDGLHPVAKGIVLGLTIGAGARLAVRAWVVTDISAFEPLSFLLIPVPFVVAAVIACYVPASRASRVDPNIALRDL
jgi:predicted permease